MDCATPAKDPGLRGKSDPAWVTTECGQAVFVVRIPDKRPSCFRACHNRSSSRDHARVAAVGVVAQAGDGGPPSDMPRPREMAPTEPIGHAPNEVAPRAAVRARLCRSANA